MHSSLSRYDKGYWIGKGSVAVAEDKVKEQVHKSMTTDSADRRKARKKFWSKPAKIGQTAIRHGWNVQQGFCRKTRHWKNTSHRQQYTDSTQPAQQWTIISYSFLKSTIGVSRRIPLPTSELDDKDLQALVLNTEHSNFDYNQRNGVALLNTARKLQWVGSETL